MLHENYRNQLHFKDDAGTEFPFTCAKKVCGPNDPQAILFYKRLEEMFTSMNGNETKYHTRKGRLFDLNSTDDDKQQKKKVRRKLYISISVPKIIRS